MIPLKFGITFEDLYRREGLLRLDERFLQSLESADSELHARLLEVRQASSGGRTQQSELILDLAPRVEDFLAELFGIQAEVHQLRLDQAKFADLYTVKRKFIHKRALSGMNAEKAAALDGPALECELKAGSKSGSEIPPERG